MNKRLRETMLIKCRHFLLIVGLSLLLTTSLSADEIIADDVPPELSAWLADNAVPFATDDPTGDLSDLAPLSAMVGDARIVGFGEATHGTAEFFRMKHRTLRYLVEEEGFRVFLIEANMPETIGVNEYIMGGDGTPEYALALMKFWTWNTGEVRTMVEWMREWNNEHPDDPVYFYGFDSQFWLDGVGRFLVYLDDVDPDYASDLRKRIYCFGEPNQQPDPDDTCGNIIADAQVHYAAHRDDYIAQTSEFAYLLHRQVLQTLADVTDLYAGDNYFNIRDRAMANHVIAYAEDLFPEERIVLWAHNGHIQSSIFAEVARPMGLNLHEHFGEDYISVGFAFLNGSFNAISQDNEGNRGSLRPLQVLPPLPDSHERVLASIDEPRFLLDTRVDDESAGATWLGTQQPLRFIGAIYNPDADEEQFAMPTVLRDAFDILIYFEETSPSQLLPR